MSAINLIKQAESLAFAFDLGINPETEELYSLSGWTCSISVIQFPTGDIYLTRAVTAAEDTTKGTSGQFSGFLTKTETNALGAGQYALVATMINSTTDEQVQKKIRFQVSKVWTGGASVNPGSASAIIVHPWETMAAAQAGLIFIEGISLPYSISITDFLIRALSAPTVTDINVTLLVNGVAHGEVGVLTAGSKGPQITTFATPIAVPARALLDLKFTQAGSGVAGSGISGHLEYLKT